MAASIVTPTVGAERAIRISRVAAARRALRDPPSWTTLFVKAYSLVAARHPELRRVYLTMPWARFYEHPHSIASILVEREWRGEPSVFLHPLAAPEANPITTIERTVLRLKRDPIDSIGSYKRMIHLTRLPWLLRRAVWWYGLRWSGNTHGRFFGTFAISSMAVPRSRAMNLMSPWTVYLLHAPPTPAGVIDLYGTFDHRVLDGMVAVRALGEVEAVLNDEIVEELRGLREPRQSAAALVPTPTSLGS